MESQKELAAGGKKLHLHTSAVGKVNLQSGVENCIFPCIVSAFPLEMDDHGEPRTKTELCFIFFSFNHVQSLRHTRKGKIKGKFRLIMPLADVPRNGLF
jgi:hypothetical protein